MFISLLYKKQWEAPWLQDTSVGIVWYFLSNDHLDMERDTVLWRTNIILLAVYCINIVIELALLVTDPHAFQPTIAAYSLHLGYIMWTRPSFIHIRENCQLPAISEFVPVFAKYLMFWFNWANCLIPPCLNTSSSFWGNYNRPLNYREFLELNACNLILTSL